jgi:RNA polymerase sigma factor (sigma-70 family)
MNSIQQQMVVDHMWLAEKVAVKWYIKFHGKKLDEYLSASYYGLCLAVISSEEVEEFIPYARMVCRNTVIKDYHRMHLHPHRETMMMYKSLINNPIVDEDEIDKEKILLHLAIKKLTKRRQEVIQGRLNGLELPQIAADLGIGISITKKHSMLALRMLKKLLT